MSWHVNRPAAQVTTQSEAYQFFCSSKKNLTEVLIFILLVPSYYEGSFEIKVSRLEMLIDRVFYFIDHDKVNWYAFYYR